MSIAAANLFTRNIYREYLRPDLSHKEETMVAKITSLVVKIGALAFIVFAPPQYAINLQLLGGIWILQTFPAIIFGLYTRWFHPMALVAGWAIGMTLGTGMVASMGLKSSVYALHLGGVTLSSYAAVYALLANLAIATVATAALKVLGTQSASDETSAADYIDVGVVGQQAVAAMHD